MSNWNYVREEPNAIAGKYRFEVVEAEEKTSQSGKNMIVVSLRLNGTSTTVKDYFVEGEWFNKKVTSFFDSTNIDEGDFNLLSWVGAIGAATFKEGENGYLKVAYYISNYRAAQMTDLPEWKGKKPERQKVGALSGATGIDDGELPF